VSFRKCLKVSNVFDSLIVAGNLFQIVGAIKLKERLLKLVVQKGIDKRCTMSMCQQQSLLHCYAAWNTLPT